MDAIKEHEVFLTGSLSQEQRWPEFTSRARERTGVESILSLRLFAREDTLGSLNLYSVEPNAFDDDDVAVASVFAAHAAVALAGDTREAQLEAKADSRDVIGMAKGIIMAGQSVSDDEAFTILRPASQRTKRQASRAGRPDRPYAGATRRAGRSGSIAQEPFAPG